jgi:hydroxymethylglutaryl-CoA lyase
VVRLLDGLGIASGLDLDRLADTALWICAQLERAPASKVTQALSAKRARAACASG